MKDIFDEFQSIRNDSINYDFHPATSVLEQYVQDQLAEGIASPALLSRLLSGELKEQEWNDFTVSTHVQTCVQCKRKTNEIWTEFQEPLLDFLRK